MFFLTAKNGVEESPITFKVVSPVMFHSTPLPEVADVARIDRLLRRIRAEAARRFFARVPGPFGRDAPELPVARWSP